MAVTVPVMVYVVVLAGLACTTGPEVALKPVDGLQLNVVPAMFDETESGTAGLPAHRELGTGVRTGSGLIVTVMLSVALHPRISVAVSVIFCYPEPVSVMLGLDVLVFDKPLPDHK